MNSFYINNKLCYELPEEPIRKYQMPQNETMIIMKPIIINGYTYWIEESEDKQ